MKKYTGKHFVIISLLLGFVILMGLISILPQQYKKSEGARFDTRTANIYSLNKDTGVALNPENLPEGLMLYE